MRGVWNRLNLKNEKVWVHIQTFLIKDIIYLSMAIIYLVTCLPYQQYIILILRVVSACQLISVWQLGGAVYHRSNGINRWIFLFFFDSNGIFREM